MATTIKLKNSVTTTNAPSSLAQGEVAINVTDKKVWVGNAATTPVQIVGTGSGGGGAAGSNTQVQFNSSGALAGSANMVFDGSTLTTLNTAYTGTLTGGTGVVNLGSGQFYKDASGNVGIGTSSPSFKLDVVRSGNGSIAKFGNGTKSLFVFADGTASYIGSDSGVNNGIGISDSNFLACYTNSSERMRIDSSGNLLVGTTDSAENTGVGIKFIQGTSLPIIRTVLNRGDSAGVNTFVLYNTNATNNAFRFYVNVNGGINNFSGNNINLSDERSKTNIDLAGSYLDKICAIPVKLFNYKDEADGEQRTLGVIAQDVEAVAPEFVNNSDWLEKEQKYDSPLKSVYTTDLMFGMMKAIQEQQAIITDLKSRIELLEAK